MARAAQLAHGHDGASDFARHLGQVGCEGGGHGAARLLLSATRRNDLLLQIGCGFGSGGERRDFLELRGGEGARVALGEQALQGVEGDGLTHGGGRRFLLATRVTGTVVSFSLLV